jgi:hypothetical protein
MRRSALLTAALVAAAVGIAGCGGDDTSAPTSSAGEEAFLPNLPEPQLDDQNRFARGSSVGDGKGPAPTIDPVVRKAAKDAGCTVRAFASEGNTHVQTEQAPTYGTQPPTSGNHWEVPIKFGVYDTPVPDMPTVHALEHGAVIVYVGKDVPAAEREGIGRFWAESPPYVIVMPGRSKGFPAKGVVVTSWQRWLSCKPYQSSDVAAIRVYRDTYRGTGSEPIPAVHAEADIGFPGTPEPLVEDPGAPSG